MNEKCGVWGAGLLTLFALAAMVAASAIVGMAAWPDRGVRN